MMKFENLLIIICAVFLIYMGYNLLPPQIKMVEHCSDLKAYSKSELKDLTHIKYDLKTKIDKHFLYSTSFEICEKESIENPKLFKIKYAKGSRHNFGDKFDLFIYNLKN